MPSKIRPPDLPNEWYWMPHKCGHPQLMSVGHLLTQSEYRRLAAETRRELCSVCWDAKYKISNMEV